MSEQGAGYEVAIVAPIGLIGFEGEKEERLIVTDILIEEMRERT